jgi:hypothetical protein
VNEPFDRSLLLIVKEYGKMVIKGFSEVVYSGTQIHHQQNEFERGILNEENR